jgi:hypothetical protein
MRASRQLAVWSWKVVRESRQSAVRSWKVVRKSRQSEVDNGAGKARFDGIRAANCQLSTANWGLRMTESLELTVWSQKPLSSASRLPTADCQLRTGVFP